MSWVIEHSKHKGNSLVVLLMIANHSRSDGSGAWPSVKTLAKESRLSERTVQRSIRRLRMYHARIDPPELIYEEGKGPHGCNLYSIPGVKLSPVKGCQAAIPQVSDTVTTPVSRVSPEPSFNRPIQPRPRVQGRDARNRFDDEIERQRRIQAKTKRLEEEHDLKVAINAGGGPR